MKLNALLFGPTGVLSRILVVAGGLYLIVIGLYAGMMLITRLRNGELEMPQSGGTWYGLVALGTILASLWLGYSDGGLFVTLVVGLVPSLSFTTVVAVLRLLNLNNPDMPAWVFVIPIVFVGIGLAGGGFALGKGIQLVIQS